MEAPLFTGALSPSVLKAAVHEMLGAATEVPDNHKGELVTTINFDRIDIVLATKVVDNDHVRWDLNVVASHKWAGENQFGVLSRVTLK